MMIVKHAVNGDRVNGTRVSPPEIQSQINMSLAGGAKEGEEDKKESRRRAT